MVDLKWRDSVALPVAVFGAALGVASLFGEWSRVVLSGGETRPAWTFSTLGPFALVYVIALFALVVIVSVALFGRRRAGGKQLRVTGLAVAGLSLVLLGVLARMLARENPHWWFEYRVGSTVGQPQILGWGIYAAFGALIALGAALVLRFPVRWLQYMVVEKEPEFEGDADDLTVAVEPGDEIGR